VGIWLSRNLGGAWSKPVEVANGDWADGKRYPCWNPVLFQPMAGPLMLFYKVGPSPSKWWGMMITSSDVGASWSKAVKLPEGILGPIKNKPIELAGGIILCGSSTEDRGWRLEMEWTRDLGKTWEKTVPLNDGKAFGAIQPSILKLADGALGLVCRSKQGKVLFARSHDQGRTWSALAALDVANPNSGIDAVTLADGRQVMVYNDTPRGRTPLKVAVSADGVKWTNVLTLESGAGEYSYPAVIQTRDGKLHVTYTWKRQKVRHVVIDAEKLKG
jgi:predicted neuraminidase